MSQAEPIDLLVNARHLSGPRTGIEIYMEQLLGALGRSGRVRITALSWAPLGLEIPNLHERIAARRPALRPGSPGATAWKVWFDQVRCLRGARGSVPLLLHGMAGFLPWAVRRRDRCVATVHDLGWQAHPELYPSRIRMMYAALFPWTVRRADRFIAVSRYTADDLMRRCGIAARRIEVVHHGLDPFFREPPGETAGEAPQDERPYFLAVGGISPRKNARRLLEAFSRWRARDVCRRGYRLFVTGKSLDEAFAQGADAPPEGVSLLGYVDRVQLRRLYAGAAAFVYPGIYEGFGLPIIEAMACGAPVVTSETGAAPEIAGGAAVLVDPFSVDSIERALDQVTRPGEAARLRALGVARCREFDWRQAAETTIGVYCQLLA